MIISVHRFLTGARVLNTHIYKPGSYPFDLISPITIIWRPIIEDEESTTATQKPIVQPEPGLSKQTQKKDKKGKGKPKNVNAPKHRLPDDTPRIVWIRSHPSVFDDVFSALQISASTIVDVAKNHGRQGVEIELADLRGAVNVFEIMGDKANQVLKGALSLVPDDKRTDLKKVSLIGSHYNAWSHSFASSGHPWGIYRRPVLSLVVWSLASRFTILG